MKYQKKTFKRHPHCKSRNQQIEIKRFEEAVKEYNEALKEAKKSYYKKGD